MICCKEKLYNDLLYRYKFYNMSFYRKVQHVYSKKWTFTKHKW